jgi:hypothetical protein
MRQASDGCCIRVKIIAATVIKELNQLIVEGSDITGIITGAGNELQAVCKLSESQFINKHLPFLLCPAPQVF